MAALQKEEYLQENGRDYAQLEQTRTIPTHAAFGGAFQPGMFEGADCIQ